MRPTPRHHASRGFTLVELLLALVLTSFIGLTVTMMLAGIGNATRQQTNTRRSTMQRQVAIARLSSLTRCRAMILTASDDTVVLWKGDATGNAKPDLSELLRIDYDADAQTLWTSAAPDDLDAAQDVTYELTGNFDVITDALAGGATFPTAVALQHVADCVVELDHGDPQLARLLRMDLTLQGETGSDVATIITAARATE